MRKKGQGKGFGSGKMVTSLSKSWMFIFWLYENAAQPQSNARRLSLLITEPLAVIRAVNMECGGGSVLVAAAS